jgi:predicted nucleic acid-binding Zn ribbon protein
MSRRRPMERVGDLLDGTARRLGLERELRLARATTTWAAIVSELVPPAAGSCRLVAVDGDILLVDADAPIVAQELRLRAPELMAAMRAAPGGLPVRDLRIRVRRV